MIASLGYVTVTTPGTPVRATINQPDPTQRIGAQSVRFQVLPGNGAAVYIGSTPDFDRVTGVGVLAVLPAPVSATDGPFDSYTASLPTLPAALNAASFYIDADTGTDGVIVSYTQG